MTGMRVLFLHTHLHDEVTEALGRFCPQAEYAHCGGDFANWRHVKGAWGDDRDLAFVEQHAVLHSGIMEGFAECPEPWCTQLSEVVQPGNWSYEAFTAVRFRGSMRAEVSVAEIEAGWGSCFTCSGDGTSGTRPSPLGPGCWRHMDGAVIGALRGHEFSPHVHEPPVFHWKVHRGNGAPCQQ